MNGLSLGLRSSFIIKMSKCLQKYTGPEDIHSENGKPLFVLMKPHSETTVKKCSGKTLFDLST